MEWIVTIEPDFIPVRGNLIASGDAATDKAAEDAVFEALDRGRVEAWCVVTVEGIENGTSHYASLGACSFDRNSELVETVNELKNEIRAIFRAQPMTTPKENLCERCKLNITK